MHIKIIRVGLMVKIRKKGFTLIELLVVIAIIALLLSILMPALQKIKEQARIVVCKSNLKQLATALETYTVANENKSLSTTFRISDSPPDWSPYAWFQVLAPYLSDNKYKENPRAALEGSMKTLWCPSTKEPIDPFPNTGFGDYKHRWRFHTPGSEGEGSYGINMWVGGMDIDVQVNDFGGYISAGQARKCSLRNMQPRADTPVFADSSWTGGIPMHPAQANTYTGGFPPSMYPDQYSDYTGSNYDDRGMSRFCIDRHNLAIDIAFVDGHTEKVDIKDLWKLKWNKSFKTTNENFVLTPQ